MKITYYTYFVKNNNGMWHHNLLPFLHRFVEYNNPEFKKTFTYSQNQLYLFKLTNHIFLFVITKDSEIIKTIDSEALNYGDIYQRLQEDERLGFASYIYVDNLFYGIGSTIGGPKNTVWLDFINQIFMKLNIGKYTIDSFPLPSMATRDEILKMDIVGRTTFEIDNSNDFAKQIMGLFCADVNEIDCLEVIIKPKSKKSIINSFAKLCGSLNDDGLKKFLVKAKASIEDSLKDFYIVGKGYVSDSIKSRDDFNICEEITDKISNNPILNEKIQEFIIDERFYSDEIQDITCFNSIDNWRRILLNN